MALTHDRTTGLALRLDFSNLSRPKLLILKSWDIAGPADAASFLDPPKGSLYEVDEDTKSQFHARILNLRTTDARFIENRNKLLRSSDLEAEFNSFSVSIHAWGRVGGSLREHRFFLETPPGRSGPRFFFLIWDKTKQPIKDLESRGSVQGIYVWVDEENDADSTFDLERVDSGDFFHGDDDIPPPARFAGRMVYWLLKTHLKWTQNQISNILSRIEGLEKSLYEENFQQIKSMATQVNKYGQDIRKANLQRRIIFHEKAYAWLLNDPLRGELPQEALAQLQLSPYLRTELEEFRERLEEAWSYINLITQQQQHDNGPTEEDRQENRKYQRSSLAIGKEIARTTQTETRFVRGVTLVTFGFLPASFVTSFFGMGFFNGVGNWPIFDATSKFVWVYFICSLPVTIVTLGVFFWWEERERRENERIYVAIDDINAP